MTSRRGRVLPAVCLALCGVAESAASPRPADDKLSSEEAVAKRVDKRTEARGRTIVLRASASDLTVAAGAGDAVVVTAELRVWSRDREVMTRLKDAFDVSITEGASRLEIGVDLPRGSEPGFLRRLLGTSSLRYAIDVSVTLPASAPVEVDNSYGDVTATGLDGPVTVLNTSGDVTVRQARGPVTIEGRYGDVALERIGGDLRATTSSGDVTAANLGGSAIIETSYGDVAVTSVRGELSVSTTSGDVAAARVTGGARLKTSYGDLAAAGVDGDLVVETQSGTAAVSDVGGSLRVSGSYGDVVAERIGRSAEIATSSGSVTATAVKGDLTVRCSYGSARLREVGGRLSVAASSTEVHAETIGGPVQIETSYGSVTLSGVSGAINVVNQSGGVTVRGLTGAALSSEHRVQTTYADVDFTWPADQALSFTLESSYGRVVSRLPGALRQSGSRQILESSPAGARARLTLLSQSGNVTLRSE